MNQFTAQQKIEILDRKYNFLMSSSTEAFIYDLENFVRFLKEDEVIKDHVEKISQKLIDDRNIYQKILEDEKEKLRIYTNEESETGREISNFIYNFNIDEIIFPKSILDRLKDKLNIPRLIIPQKEDEFNTFMLKKDMEYVIEDLKYWLRKWESIVFTSAGRALEDIIYFLYSANPLFKKFGEERLEGQIGNNILEQYMFDKQNAKNVNEAIKEGTVYLGYEQSFVNTKKGEEIKKRTELNNRLKRKITRVYEAIRQEISSTRLRISLLNRYAVRCENYNRNHLTELAKKASRKVEENLTSDLALCLFDNGITVWYRVKTGKKETDLIEIEPSGTINPMLIEVKQYKSISKEKIIENFWQTISYLESHTKNNPSYEGYLIFYRLDGNLFILPEKFSYQNFTVYPILIDLAESVGSSQKGGVIISEQEIIKGKPLK